MNEDGWVKLHHPCPRCGSKDGASTNGKGWTTCFSGNHEGEKSFRMTFNECEQTGVDWSLVREDQNAEDLEDGPFPDTFQAARSHATLVEVEIRAIPSRGLSRETCERYGYGLALPGLDRQVAPYRVRGKVVAQKLRTRDKRMPWVGDVDCEDLELFGEHTLSSTGKIVVVTEGEIDAMSVSQAQGNKWAAVSIAHGAKGARKDLAARLHVFDGYERVVLMFDQDKAGKDAAEECAGLFRPGQCYIAVLESGYKDANEALVAGRADLITRAMWQAVPWRPDGLVGAEQIKERILENPTMGLPFFDDRLTTSTLGRHYQKGQVWVIGAGVSVGKTAWLLRQMYFDLCVLEQRVGAFLLETETAEVYQRLASIAKGRVFHLPSDTPDPQREEELWGAVQTYSSRLLTYDSFGAADLEVIIRHIRYMAEMDPPVRLFYVDNLTQLTEEERMRESVEEAAKALKSVATEKSLIIMLASHLASPPSGSHEEGAPVSLRQFYGSRKLPAWVDGAIGLERDTVHRIPRVRETTIARVLKCRLRGGATGQRFGYRYDEQGDTLEIDPMGVEIFDKREDEDFLVNMEAEEL